MPRALLRWSVFWAVVLVVVLPTLAAEPAVEQETEEKFIRVARDEDERPTAMQTAIVTYQGKSKDGRPLTVDLIGAVHVGDKKYYETLNKEFEKYDALLFELVAPEGMEIPRGGGAGSGHPIGLLQNGMKGILELEHQLEIVDYTKDNFIHADMSPEDFAKSMADRNESLVAMFFRMMGQGIAMQSKQQSRNPDRNPDAELLMALFSDNRAMLLKRLMAEQFEDLEAAMMAISGPDGSTIITERNKVALGVLAEQIDAGKTRLGIFYGAGHLSDMHERLLNEFKFRRTGERWITAWDLGDTSD